VAPAGSVPWAVLAGYCGGLLVVWGSGTATAARSGRPPAPSPVPPADRRPD
jgi:hypothetical protein